MAGIDRKGEAMARRTHERSDETLDIIVPRIYCKSPSGKLTMEQLCELYPRDFHLGRSQYELNLITGDSPKTAREATETLAYYFRREFGYDFVQYSAQEDADPRDRVFLWTVNRYSYHAGIGAACFRWREYDNAAPRLSLAWVWIHPYLRRHGILTGHWDYFRALYGDFLVEPPLSHPMKAFINKRGECWRCGRVCEGNHK